MPDALTEIQIEHTTSETIPNPIHALILLDDSLKLLKPPFPSVLSTDGYVSNSLRKVKQSEENFHRFPPPHQHLTYALPLSTLAQMNIHFLLLSKATLPGSHLSLSYIVNFPFLLSHSHVYTSMQLTSFFLTSYRLISLQQNSLEEMH